MSEFTLESELSPEEIQKCKERATQNLEGINTKELNLEKDELREFGQNYALVSFVSPTANQKSKAMGMKIKGCFSTIEEARESAARHMKIDPTFDIYVLEMNCWCAVPPDPDLIKDQEYYEETLNTMVAAHRESQEQSKEFYNERKAKLISQTEEENKIKRELNSLETGEEIKAPASLVTGSEPGSSTPSEILDTMREGKVLIQRAHTEN